MTEFPTSRSSCRGAGLLAHSLGDPRRRGDDQIGPPHHKPHVELQGPHERPHLSRGQPDSPAYSQPISRISHANRLDFARASNQQTGARNMLGDDVTTMSAGSRAGRATPAGPP